MIGFMAQKAVDCTVQWIRDYFSESAQKKAVVGISGGKDSSVVAALCARALGKENVLGVMLPDGEQPDIEASYDLVYHLGIPFVKLDISPLPEILLSHMRSIDINPTEQAITNLPARIRMAALFAVAQSVGGRVANTCNLSEDYVGYATLFGDNAGQFAPICNFTVTEVKEMGRVLGLPEHLVEKVPTDGLCGKTDEENLGFTYETLDHYIRTGSRAGLDPGVVSRIDELHEKNRFKLEFVRLPCPNVLACDFYDQLVFLGCNSPDA